jgi:hypothetical protein
MANWQDTNHSAPMHGMSAILDTHPSHVQHELFAGVLSEPLKIMANLPPVVGREAGEIVMIGHDRQVSFPI